MIATLPRAWLEYNWLFPTADIQRIVDLYGTRIQKSGVDDGLLILDLESSGH
jgi:hypothetical protein